MFGEINFDIIQSLGLLFFDLGTEVKIKKTQNTKHPPNI